MVGAQPNLPRIISENGLAHVFDAMAVIQMTKSGRSAIFGEIVYPYYNYFTAPIGRNGCQLVDVVFDRYLDLSIKAGKRKKRGTCAGLQVKTQPHICSKTVVQMHVQPRQQSKSICIFGKPLMPNGCWLPAHPQFKPWSGGLHTEHASHEYGRLILQSPDTDVTVHVSLHQPTLPRTVISDRSWSGMKWGMCIFTVLPKI